MTKAVLLPGLDGTGRLLEGLASALATDTTVVAYPFGVVWGLPVI